MRHDERGREIPDPTPVAMPAGLSKPESMQDMIRRFVRLEASRAAEASGYESFEEADDFEPDDVELDDIQSPYVTPVDMVAEDGPEGPESIDGNPSPGQPEDKAARTPSSPPAGTENGEETV